MRVNACFDQSVACLEQVFLYGAPFEVTIAPEFISIACICQRLFQAWNDLITVCFGPVQAMLQFLINNKQQRFVTNAGSGGIRVRLCQVGLRFSNAALVAITQRQGKSDVRNECIITGNFESAHTY